MDKEFLIVDNHIEQNGNVTTEFKHCDGKLLIKQFSGTNCENYIVKKYNGRKIEFSLFKLNGVYYVNLNGNHIIDYRKFTNIQYLSNIEIHEKMSVKLGNPYVGEILIENCDVDVIHKSLEIMSEWMRKKASWFGDFMYFVFH
jgi:hypothetical protein